MGEAARARGPTHTGQHLDGVDGVGVVVIGGGAGVLQTVGAGVVEDAVGRDGHLGLRQGEQAVHLRGGGMWGGAGGREWGWVRVRVKVRVRGELGSEGEGCDPGDNTGEGAGAERAM